MASPAFRVFRAVIMTTTMLPMMMMTITYKIATTCAGKLQQLLHVVVSTWKKPDNW